MMSQAAVSLGTFIEPAVVIDRAMEWPIDAADPSTGATVIDGGAGGLMPGRIDSRVRLAAKACSAEQRMLYSASVEIERT